MDLINQLKQKALRGKGLEKAEALELFIEGSGNPYAVFAAASEIREQFKGKNIVLCGIANAKSGRCSEDCKFCAQSAHYPTESPEYPMKSPRKLLDEAVLAKKNGVEYFGIVTSGKSVKSAREWKIILQAIENINKIGITPCVSPGLLNKKQALELRAAGLIRYHHNLETARSFFKKICSTHDYEENVAAIRSAKAAGLEVCAGALIGMQEGITHRIELAGELQNLHVDSVPINILTPIKGTPLDHLRPPPPMEILMTIAVYRFMLPDKDIKLCGGKEIGLRQLLPLGIVAGANSLMTGNYLTTGGSESKLDHEIIADLGLTPTRELDICTCGQKKKRQPHPNAPPKSPLSNSSNKKR